MDFQWLHTWVSLARAWDYIQSRSPELHQFSFVSDSFWHDCLPVNIDQMGPVPDEPVSRFKICPQPTEENSHHLSISQLSNTGLPQDQLSAAVTQAWMAMDGHGWPWLAMGREPWLALRPWSRSFHRKPNGTKPNWRRGAAHNTVSRMSMEPMELGVGYDSKRLTRDDSTQFCWNMLELSCTCSWTELI